MKRKRERERNCIIFNELQYCMQEQGFFLYFWHTAGQGGG